MPTGVYERKPRPRPDPLTRFWRFVRKDPDGCWEWIGGRTNKSYGAFWVDGRTLPAHRYLFERLNGPLDPQLFVCHRCDNPPCVRPDHLFAGTTTDNMQDAIRKGRFDPFRITRTPKPRGEQNGQSVLTEKQVREIRRRYQPGHAGRATPNSLCGLARQYGVSKFAIQYALRIGWCHLSDVVKV